MNYKSTYMKYIVFLFILNIIKIVNGILIEDNVWIFNNWNINNWEDKWNIQKGIKYGQENIDFIQNPINNTEKVLKVIYPKGSYKPSNKNNIGGLGFYANPLSIPKINNVIVSFQYDIYFQNNFQWNKGGKLPGLYGGHSSCSGGINAGNNECFSTRYMWRQNGLGELYAYLPKKQIKSFCDDIVMGCSGTGFGYSIDRGSFKFTSGKWYTLKQELKLNSKPGLPDGYIKVFFGDNKNMSLIINENNIDYKLTNNIYITGIDFETFFGGGDKSYASPITQYTLYKNFILNYKN